MSIQAKTLRPGLLVAMSTSIKGNVDYTKTVLEEEHVDESGQLVGSWQTDKIVFDAAEQDAAVKLRSKARGLITSICAKSDFGYLCTEAREADLEAAIKKANDICAEFNLTARITEVNFFVFTGRFAADDVKAIRAIKGDLNSLLESMEAGVRNLDVEAVRAAANKAKKLGTMLAPAAQGRLQSAIDAARAAAVKIVKAGEQAAEAVDEATLAQLTSSRTAFLDLDGAVEMQDAADTTGRAIDLTPQDDDLIADPETRAPDIDVEDLM